MMETASPTGTLVKREETSHLTRISSLSTCTLSIISVKCLEFLTWELASPAKGDMRDVMCFDSWWVGDPMHETMGLSGISGL